MTSEVDFGPFAGYRVARRSIWQYACYGIVGIALFASGAAWPASGMSSTDPRRGGLFVTVRTVPGKLRRVDGDELKRLLVKKRLYFSYMPVTVSDSFGPDGTWSRSSVGGVVSTLRSGRYSIEGGVVSIVADALGDSPVAKAMVSALNKPFEIYRNRTNRVFVKYLGASDFIAVTIENDNR